MPLAFLTACTGLPNGETVGTAEEAVVQSFAPNQDTQTRENTSTTNFGSSATGGVAGTAGTRKTLLAGFDVSAIPANAGVTSAVLTLTHYNAPVGAGTLEAHQVSGTWAEMTTTWATMPAYSATIAGSAAITATTTISVDVTSIVSAWVNGATNNGIALVENGGSAVFWTREATAAQRPTLTVTWTAPPTCTDAIKNGAESDTDCGGTTCSPCANGKQCAGSADCQSGYCGSGTCAPPPPTCNDGIKNGAETDVDCGGPSCGDCANGKLCSADGDCLSGYCGSGRCAPPPPTCTDGIANGSETDVDCGGPNCAPCVNGKHCAALGDCQSGYCGSGGLCATPPPTCTDGIKNGSETDVDCGGGTCAKCPVAKHCSASSDCGTGLCYAGTCYAQGTAGTVVNSCSLPSLPTGYGESVQIYKPSDTATGWGVLTTPPAGTTVIGGALLIHGGRWRDGSTGPGTGASPWPYDDNDTARKLAKLGYVVFSPAYRSSATFVHPAQASDSLCAARYLRDTMAASYPGAPSGLFTLGSSAGAHLSVLITQAPVAAVDDGTCPRSGAVTWRGAIGWSGVYDFTAYIPKASSAAAVAEVLGFSPSANPAGALAASPWSYVSPFGADVLVTHGATDPTLPAAGTSAFHLRALAMGVDSTEVQITNAYSFLHAGPLFDGIRPSQGCTALQFLATH